MNYHLVGVNHRTAPVELRERLAISEPEMPQALASLLRHPGVEEGLILSTCNRVEVLACANGTGCDLRGFLAHYFSIPEELFRKAVYEFQGNDAVRHIFRVAASLDSMVVGEPQILGQVKEFYALARSTGAVRAQLEPLLSRAFSVAKRVRTETSVGSSAVSVASVAVELARKIFDSLEGKQVLLVGAGKMSELAARHLVAQGAKHIMVSNRTPERAQALAQKFGGTVVHFGDLYDMADRADIVITSTGASQPIFTKKHGELFVARRKNRPMFLIDIAVPRDVAPEMNQVEGIFVYDIDDLQAVVSTHVNDRQREATRAEQIIEAEVVRFQQRVQTLDVVPTIASLQEHLETIRQAEIDKVRSRMGKLTPEQEMAIESMTRGIVNKILHVPITTLKSAARENHTETTTLVDLVRRLFNLTEKSSKVGGQE